MACITTIVVLDMSRSCLHLSVHLLLHQHNSMHTLHGRLLCQLGLLTTTHDRSTCYVAVLTPYTISITALFQIVSPPTKCTFTYRVTSGSFASLVPVKPAGGLEGSCAATPGTYQPTIAGAKVSSIY